MWVVGAWDNVVGAVEGVVVLLKGDTRSVWLVWVWLLIVVGDALVGWI